MARPKDPGFVELQWFYYRQSRTHVPKFAEIKEHLEQFRGRRGGDSTFYKWLQILRDSGFIDEHGLAHEPPLQTYLLLLDVPGTGRRLRRIEEVLREHDHGVVPERVSGLFNVLVRTRATGAGQIEELARKCREAGARDARPLLRLPVESGPS